MRLRTLLLPLVFCAPASAQDALRLGAASIRFEGVKTLSRDRILADVAADRRYLELTAAGAKLEPWLALVRERARDHYLSSGQFAAKVDAVWDAARSATVLTVDGGPVFTWAEPEIRTGPTIGAEKIRAELPIQRGAPAEWSDARGDAVQRAVRKLLAEAGCLDAQVEVAIGIIGSDQVALEVDVQDEGPVAHVQALEILGDDDDAAQGAVRSRLAFARDATLTPALIGRIEDELAGLFRYARIQPRPGPRSDDGACILALELSPAPTGLDPSSPIPEPLDIMGRCARWLRDHAATELTFGWSASYGDALVGNVPFAPRSMRVRFGSHAALISLDDIRIGDTNLGTVEILATPERWSLGLPSLGWRTDLGGLMAMEFTWTCRLDAEDPTHGETRWGVGVNTRKRGEAPISTSVDIEPLALMQARDKGVIVLAEEDDHLRLRLEDGTDLCRIDRDGALSDLGFAFAEGDIDVRLTVERGGDVADEVALAKSRWADAGLESVAPVEAAVRLCRIAIGEDDTAPILEALARAAGNSSMTEQHRWLADSRRWLAQVPSPALALLGGRSAASPPFVPPYDSWFEQLTRLTRRLAGAPHRAAARPALEDFVNTWFDGKHTALAAWAAAEYVRSFGLVPLSQHLAGGYEGGTHWNAVRVDVEVLIANGNALGGAIDRIGAIWKGDERCRDRVGGGSASDRAAGLAGLGILWNRWLEAPLARRLDALRQ